MTPRDALPLVALHLFLDDANATLPPHPSVRTGSPVRYLECALTQAASLRLGGAPCDIALVTNATSPRELGRRARRLHDALASFEVEFVPCDLRIPAGTAFSASRLLRTAVRTASEGHPGAAQLWLPNADCVWPHAERVFAAAPGPQEVGCLFIPYPPDWEVGGPAAVGSSRGAIGRLALEMGGSGDPPPWVGGDLLGGNPGALGNLMAACDELETRLSGDGAAPTGEQLLTLAGALGRVRYHDLSGVARRIQTGARHRAAPPADAADLGLWHLPAEKGLSLRRAATSVLCGHAAELGEELADPQRACRRFNVGRARRGRQLRDDAWVLARRALT